MCVEFVSFVCIFVLDFYGIVMLFYYGVVLEKLSNKKLGNMVQSNLFMYFIVSLLFFLGGGMDNWPYKHDCSCSSAHRPRFLAEGVYKI